MPYREPLGTKTLRDIDRGIEQMRWSMRNYQRRIEQHMKSHAVWRDQTGNARRNLRARLEETALPNGDVRLLLILDYGEPGAVPYDVHLERMQSGRFAIVGPTADVFGPRIRRRIQALTRGTGISAETVVRGGL